MLDVFLVNPELRTSIAISGQHHETWSMGWVTAVTRETWSRLFGWNGWGQKMSELCAGHVDWSIGARPVSIRNSGNWPSM